MAYGDLSVSCARSQGSSDHLRGQRCDRFVYDAIRQFADPIVEDAYTS